MKPTAVQIAEDLNNIYQNAADVYHNNPNQAVFILQDIINLLKNYGHPEPDFKTFTALFIARTDKDTYRALMRKVGVKIEQAMKDKGLTFDQLARMTNKPLASVHRWTSGQNMELQTLFIIEKHLGIKLINL